MKQLDTKAVWLFFWDSLISTVIFTPLIVFLLFVSWTDIFSGTEGYFSVESLLTWAAAIFVLGGIVTFVFAKLTYRFYRYELSEQGFKKESGIIWKKYVTIPYARIQNVDINRGVLDRLLGLSEIDIQTAGTSASMSRYGMGGGGAEGKIPGVTRAEAEMLRDELVRRASGSIGQGV